MREIFPGIAVDSEIKGGKPVIKGTRIPVDLLLGKLAGGAEYEEVMEEYELTRDQIYAVLRYAANIISGEQVKVI